MQMRIHAGKKSVLCLSGFTEIIVCVNHYTYRYFMMNFQKMGEMFSMRQNKPIKNRRNVDYV